MCPLSLRAITAARTAGSSGCGDALFDDYFLARVALAGVLSCGGTHGSGGHGGVGQAVRGDVFLVRFSDDLEGAGIVIWDVGDGVPVLGRFVGDRAQLSDGQLAFAPGENLFECLVVREGDEGPGTLAGGGRNGDASLILLQPGKSRGVSVFGILSGLDDDNQYGRHHLPPQGHSPD